MELVAGWVKVDVGLWVGGRGCGSGGWRVGGSGLMGEEGREREVSI